MESLICKVCVFGVATWDVPCFMAYSTRPGNPTGKSASCHGASIISSNSDMKTDSTPSDQWVASCLDWTCHLKDTQTSWPFSAMLMPFFLSKQMQRHRLAVACSCSDLSEHDAKNLTFISEVPWSNSIWTSGQQDKEKVGNLHSYQSAHWAALKQMSQDHSQQ